MQIYILGKKDFNEVMLRAGVTNDTVELYDDSFFISINDTTGHYSKSYFKEHDNVKVLNFDDVEEDVVVEYLDNVKPRFIAKAFSEEQAKDLFEFIQKHRNKKVCYVHCSAGISRSGGVGTFINDYMEQDYFDFMNKNPHIHPNGTVVRLLKNQHNIFLDQQQ